MPYQVDRTKSARQNFIDLLNTGATYSFVGTEFTEPSGVEPYTDTEFGISNTQVTLEATPNSGFVGTKTVYYRRLTAGATRTAASLDFNITETDDMASLKEMVCVEHNLITSEVNLVGVLPTQLGVPVEIIVFLDPYSYVYLGGAFTVNVTLVTA